jgi:hypothetical protein
MTQIKPLIWQFWWLFLIPLTLAACGGGGGTDADVQRSYTVSLTNLTANQPLAPTALVFHQPGSGIWAPGDSADNDLEVLAEGGDPQPLLDAAAGRSEVVRVLGGSGIIPPGGKETINLTLSGDEFSENQPLAITLATMLVNTNDAFAGVSGAALPVLAVGEGRTWYLPAYDAGTEANSETAATVPGPAAGGEGFAAARDDVDRIAIHPGVISFQDGLDQSVLDGSHRWDNPVLKLEFTRTQ